MGALRRGLRNLWRSRGRSLLAATVLALSVAIALSMVQGARTAGARVAALRQNVATLLFVREAGNPGTQSRNPLRAQMAAELARLPGVATVESYVSERVVEETVPPIGSFQGVVPGQALRLSTMPHVVTKVTAGRGFAAADVDKAVAIVGKTYAANHNLSVGSRFSLAFRKQDRQIVAARSGEGGARELSFEVIGIHSAGFTFGDNQVLLPFGAVQQAFGKEGQVTELAVRAASIEQVAAVRQVIEEAYPGRVDVLSLAGKAESASGFLQGLEASGRVAAGLAMATGALVAFFTLLLVTRERTQEIGILKALGASSTEVALQLLGETIALGTLAGLAGITIYAFAGPALAQAFLEQLGKSSSVGENAALVKTQVQGELTFGLAVAGLALAALVSLLGAAYPVWSAVRMRPVEALRRNGRIGYR